MTMPAMMKLTNMIVLAPVGCARRHYLRIFAAPIEKLFQGVALHALPTRQQQQTRLGQ